MNGLLTPDMVAGLARHVSAFGKLASLTFVGASVAPANSMVYVYRANFPAGPLRVVMTRDAAGKISGWYFRPPQ